ncbi:MAG: hypothetical protein QNJ11_13995 [Woeseiaceae bacterium]|nr:hypothetical protein [Woeseiaceae bacterium]
MIIKTLGPHNIALPLIVLLVLPWSSALAQQVALISGNGFEPSNLARGSNLPVNSLVRADNNTIIVVFNQWNMGNGQLCEHWVIVRGRQYQVQASTPNRCNETGSGNELGRAIAGTSMVAHVRAIQFSDAKSDIPRTRKLAQLDRDLYSLIEQEEARQREIEERRRAEREEARQRQIAERERAAREEARQRELEERRRAEREEARRRELAERQAAGGENGTNAETKCLRLVHRSAQRDSAERDWWDAARVKQLCAGTRDAAEPPRCFGIAMRGARDPRLPALSREDAFELCRGTSDAVRTYGCLRKLQDNNVARKLAVEACSGGD